MRAFERWLCTKEGQIACVVVGAIALVAYVFCIIFENEWGD